MKVLFHGEEIELDDKLEKGEKELDMSFIEDELEDTIELDDIEKIVTNREYDLSQTKEFKLGEFDYE